MSPGWDTEVITLLLSVPLDVTYSVITDWGGMKTLALSLGKGHGKKAFVKGKIYMQELEEGSVSAFT